MLFLGRNNLGHINDLAKKHQFIGSPNVSIIKIKCLPISHVYNKNISIETQVFVCVLDGF